MLSLSYLAGWGGAALQLSSIGSYTMAAVSPTTRLSGEYPLHSIDDTLEKGSSSPHRKFSPSLHRFHLSDLLGSPSELYASQDCVKFKLPWMTFASDLEQIRYDKFLEREVRTLPLYILIAPTFVMASVALAYVIKINMSWFHVIPRICYIAMLLIALVYAYCVRDGGMPVTRNLKLNTVILANVVIILNAIIMGWILLSRVLVGHCHNMWPIVCNAQHQSIPMDHILQVILSSTLLPMFMKTHRWWSLILSYVITILSGVYANMIGDFEFTLLHLEILIMFVFQLFGLYEYDFCYVKTYVSIMNLEATVRSKISVENEKEVMQMQSTELRHLIGNVAHDLKTPVQGFMMEVDNLEATNSLQSKQESVRSLRATCAFMNMTINRAIDYTKANAGITLVPSLETVNVPYALDWAKHCVGKSPLGVSVIISPLDARQCKYVITDKQWLLENLLCLLSNAMKFSIEGSIVINCKLITTGRTVDHNKLWPTRPGRVNSNPSSPRSSRKNLWTNRSDNLPCDTLKTPVAETPAGAMLRFEVEDSGVGIPVEQRSALFSPFKQAQRRAGGTGLGLYSLSKRIESIGGEYGVCSRSDGTCGSCFWFTIPYRPDDSISSDDDPDGDVSAQNVASRNRSLHNSEDSDGSQCSKPPEGDRMGNDAFLTPRAPKRQTRILVVDDSILIQKTTARALTRAGFGVDIATNGAHCLSLLVGEDTDYGVILMDLQMPVLDGIETVKRIRCQEAVQEKNGTLRSKKFIIGLSANSDTASQGLALSAGMNSFIAKPLSVQQLVDCCKRENIPLFTDVPGEGLSK